MSGATTMYALKPVVSISRETYKPKTMYAMKNINEIREHLTTDHTNHKSKIVSDITEQVIKFLKSPLPEVVELEIRQEKILAQLAELKEQVSSLCGILKITTKSQSTSTSDCKKKAKICTDFVINANPSKPPFSILALQELWKDTDIQVSSYIHSSASSQPLEFPLIQKNCNSANNTVHISLIWKKVTDLDVVISASHGMTLLGEVNLLRYLSRLITSHNYENTICGSESLKVDTVLDLCQQLYFQESPKDSHLIFTALSTKLGSDQWLVGASEPSIADVAAWSAIKQLNFQKLPKNLTNWFTRCEKIFLHKQLDL